MLSNHVDSGKQGRRWGQLRHPARRPPGPDCCVGFPPSEVPEGRAGSNGATALTPSYSYTLSFSPLAIHHMHQSHQLNQLSIYSKTDFSIFSSVSHICSCPVLDTECVCLLCTVSPSRFFKVALCSLPHISTLFARQKQLDTDFMFSQRNSYICSVFLIYHSVGRYIRANKCSKRSDYPRLKSP